MRPPPDSDLSLRDGSDCVFGGKSSVKALLRSYPAGLATKVLPKVEDVSFNGTSLKRSFPGNSFTCWDRTRSNKQ